MKQLALSSENELGFNPGMDLMVSLFAMSLLIMFVGVFFYNGVVAITNEDVIDKAKDILQLEAEIEKMEDKISILSNQNQDNKELRLEKARLERQLERLKEQLEGLKTEKDSLTNALDHFTRDNPQYANLSLSDMLERLQQEIKTLNFEIERTKARVIFELRETEAASFKMGTSILTNTARTKLRKESPKMLSELKKQSVNQINILGYASPEKKPLKGNADGNLDLSVERSIAVAHYLKSLGIPYECMKITGFGRGRSEILYKWKQKIPGHRSIDDWDKQGIPSTAKYKQKSREERKVVLQVVYDQESKCTM